MLDRLFLQILNMSFTASIVILFVLAARMLLKKTPKIFSYALWSVVLFRLVCPFSFESVISLLPTKASPIPSDIMYAKIPQINIGVPIINNSVNAFLPAATLNDSMNPMQFWIFAGRCLWLIGIVSLLIYSVVSLVKLCRKLKDAVHESNNIYTSCSLTTPFVMGLFRPKIFLPESLNDAEKQYIILHEQTHIKRFDHFVKILSFFVLCLHWFNPLVWVAFFFSGRDMELSCDERVIKQLGSEIKKDYSSSLLTLATGRRIIGGTPLAFGEGDTKSRIKNVLSYKKPAFWVVVVSILAVVAVGVGLMANPISKDMTTPQDTYGFSPVYVFEECLYNMLALSYYPRGGTGQLYLTDPERGFAIMTEATGELQSGYSPIDWNGKTVSTKDWESLYSMSVGKVDISGYTVRMQYDIEDNQYRLYTMDSETWLAQLGNDGSLLRLYRLKAAENAAPSVASNSTPPTTFTLYNSAGEVLKQSSYPYPKTATELTSLLLAKGPNDNLQQESVNDVPMGVDEYLKIDLGGLIPDRIYFIYKSQDKFWIEEPYEYRRELEKSTYTALMGYLNAQRTQPNPIDGGGSVTYENVGMFRKDGEADFAYITNVRANHTTQKIVSCDRAMLAFDKEGNPLELDWWIKDDDYLSYHYLWTHGGLTREILPEQKDEQGKGWKLNAVLDPSVAKIAYVLFCDTQITFEDGTVWINPDFEDWRATYEGKKVDVGILENYYPYEQKITF